MRDEQQEPTISTSVLLSLYNDLSAHREEFDRGLARFKIGIKELQDLHGYITLRRFVQVFEWLAEELDDQWLGLRFSQRAGPDALGAVGYLFLSSGTLEAAMQSLSRYLEAIQSSSRVQIKYVDEFVEVQYRIDDEAIAPRRQDSEYSIGLMWRYMQLLSNNKCHLTQVSFEHERPSGIGTIYRRIFNAPVFFGRSSNELTLPLQDFRQWHEGLDPHLFPILEDHIANTLGRSSTSMTFTESVEQLLTEQVLHQGARARLVADKLKISTVTLHRRLRHEGVRFKALVDSRSKAVAVRLLRHSNTPIATISRRLGYADAAPFSRAFRRWTGTTPREYRRGVLDSDDLEVRNSLG